MTSAAEDRKSEPDKSKSPRRAYTIDWAKLADECNWPLIDAICNDKGTFPEELHDRVAQLIVPYYTALPLGTQQSILRNARKEYGSEIFDAEAYKKFKEEKKKEQQQEGQSDVGGGDSKKRKSPDHDEAAGQPKSKVLKTTSTEIKAEVNSNSNSNSNMKNCGNCSNTACITNNCPGCRDDSWGVYTYNEVAKCSRCGKPGNHEVDGSMGPYFGCS